MKNGILDENKISVKFNHSNIIDEGDNYNY